MNKLRSLLLTLFITSSLFLTGCSTNDSASKHTTTTITQEKKTEQIVKPQEYLIQKEKPKNKPTIVAPVIDIKSIPEYTDKPFVPINNNTPFFLSTDLVTESFEHYSNLDTLGRCGFAFANIGKDIMPTTKRESISHITPSGWKSVEYDNIEGNYLYNRSHLIGFQLSGENANDKNIITGTRFFNVNGMLPFENMVADYIKETNNHVLYRVTPIFENDNLIANGVLIEAKSVEDNGQGVLFNVFVYNVQPDITIDYKTGDSHLTNPVSNNNDVTTNKVNESIENTSDSTKNTEYKDTTSSNNTVSNSNVVENDYSEETTSHIHTTYVLNTDSKKIHLPSCRTIKKLKPSNRAESDAPISEIKAQGYTPCKVCLAHF